MRPEAEAALHELIAAYEDPHSVATDPRRMGRPLFGCLTPHVPLELIHAAGIIPVRVQSAGTAPLSASHLQFYTCGFSRVAVDRVTGGRYDYLEGVLASKTCDVSLSLFQICQEEHPARFSWLVSLPGNCDEEAVGYLAEEFTGLKSALEAYRSMFISPERLRESISLYNHIRAAVMTMWRRRDSGILPLTGGQLVRALKGAQVLPPETVVSLLDIILDEEPATPCRPETGLRLLMIGNSYADAGLVDMIETYGARVVYEDTTSLGRYFGDEVVGLDKDPVEALARHYASSVTGCYRLDYDQRVGRIRENLRAWKAEACINVVQKFCDTSLFEAPLLTETFRQWKIPCLIVEIDDTSPGLRQIETRIQAFLEMVGGIL